MNTKFNKAEQAARVLGCSGYLLLPDGVTRVAPLRLLIDVAGITCPTGYSLSDKGEFGIVSIKGFDKYYKNLVILEDFADCLLKRTGKGRPKKNRTQKEKTL